ncbi:uncharacterized protein LOC109860959 [Pseudomyrmex gracilis]|uniref:uncharacterized protein LOC109860959 n=1 Tax=Pseudomyrmex gracilis TaxID=219809 RepID=UPI000995214F|nr:uncharacterized protein LOC109860959 [Pseudomyrmex gracilis]
MMDRKRMIIIVLLVLLLHKETIVSSQSEIHKLIHDFFKYRIAGAPRAYQKTLWNFDPDDEQRTLQYVQENGLHGEYVIARLGMGIEYNEPSKKRL